MGNYANQLKINLTGLDKITHKKDDGCRFIQPINFKYEAIAMRNLSGNTFKVWRYLLRWYGKEYFYYSPSAINQELGLGKNGASTAREELLRKGYITATNKPNVYTFCPVLPMDYENLNSTTDLE